MPRTKTSKEDDDDEIELSPSPPRQSSSHSSRKKEHHRHRHEHHNHHTSSSSSNSVSKRDHHSHQHHSSAKKSSTSSSTEKLSLSVDETNKLRAKLGLKPLEVTVTATTVVDEKKSGESNSGGTKIKDDWGEFIHKPAANLSDRKQTEKLKEKLANRKNKRRLDEKFANVKTLGESSSDEDGDNKSGGTSVARWVSKTKEKEEKEKLLAKKRSLIYDEYENDVLDEARSEEVVPKKKVKRDEKEVQQRYNESNLKGLKIEHSAADFETGSITILHLKDSNILDGDEGDAEGAVTNGGSGADVLVNTNLMQNETYRQSNENKKFRFGLRPSYQLAEEEEEGEAAGKNILSKYDDEIGLKAKASFVIGMDVDAGANGRDKKKAENAGFNLNVDEDRMTSRNRLASDYYTEEEMSVRFKTAPSKRKGKKRNNPEKKLRKSEVYDDDDRGGVAVVDEEIEHQAVLDEIDDDFDSIGEQLNRIRRMQQQREILTVRRELKIEPQFDEADTSAMDATDANGSHMVLDSVAEFCRTLGDIPTYGRAGNRETNDSELLDFETGSQNEKHATEGHVKHGKRAAGSGSSSSGWNKIDENSDQTNGSSSSTTVSSIVAKAPILDEEPTIGTGVAAALKLAMTKGYLEKETTKKPSSSRFKYLEAKNYSIEDKNHGGGQDDFGGGPRGGYHGGNRRDRYSDFKEKEIKPTFKLDYRDDEGKILNAKEAFRHLSHKFHGKGPGRNKIEKRLRKKEQERLMTKMSSTDTPLGTLNLLRHKQKESKMPFVVLAGGSSSSSSSGAGLTAASTSKNLTSNAKS